MEELQAWWQSLTPEMRMTVQNGSFAVAALFGGFFLGALVARTLRARNFDALLRMPTAAPPAEPDRGFTPTYIAGWLVRLTVWAGAGWWLALRYGQTSLAGTLEVGIKRTWALAAILVAALALGGLLARRLLECLHGSPATADGLHARNGAGSTQRNAAGIAAAGAYVFVVLLALLVAADMFDWPLTRNSALALWQFGQHLLVAGAALMIGCLGARWARDLASTGANTPEQRAGQYTALGIVAATTVLAVAVMLSSAGVLLGLAVLAILGFLVWLVRGYFPDVTAGLELRTHKVSEAVFDGVVWQVTEIGLVSTTVCNAGEIARVPNRAVLQARMQAAPHEPARAASQPVHSRW